MSTYTLARAICFAASSLALSSCSVATRAPDRPAAQPLVGLADIHNHQFAYLGFGGLAVVGEAFPDEPTALSTATDVDIHLADHIGDPLSEFDGPEAGFFPNSGYPAFVGWPRWSSVDHQQVYYEWLKQAYDGGLRLMSVLAVNNEVLCQLLQDKKQRRIYPSCSDMEAVQRQVDAAKALERYIDTLNGGPGKGWYRIVRSSEEAKDIVGKGQLAVVLGVEVSNLFGCNQAMCTEADVDRQLDILYAMGVRQVFVVHEFNNDFAGAAMFRNELNFGNWHATGQYFEAVDCSGDGFTYKFAPTLTDIFFKLYTNTDVWGPPPRYPGRADCNCLGLTPLGAYLVEQLMNKKMIIDVDHMSNRATNDTLDLAEARHYPVISSHSTFLGITRKTQEDNQQSEFHKTPVQIRRIRDLGGLVAPILQTFKKEQTIKIFGLPLDCDYCSEEWAQRYLYAVGLMTEGGRPSRGIPFGSDFNGVIHHVAPRRAEATWAPATSTPNAATTSARSEDAQQVRPSADSTEYKLKTKVWAFRTDGLAHIGLLPGFIEDLRDIGLSDADLVPLSRGAAAYVQMWERIDSGQLAASSSGDSR
jgi:microsomal dipeptidase-like Zn-dependent dipeptidase